MPKWNALIFDLDGTLWDTVDTCAKAWNLAFAKQRIQKREITHEDIRSSMGMTFEELRNKLFSEFSPEVGKKLLQACFDEEVMLITSGPAKHFLYPQVSEVLEELSENHTLFLVSNCDEAYLEAFWKVSGLKGLFEDWECHGRTGLSKAENIKLLMSRRLSTQNLQCVYIGDTLSDQQAAFKAHLPFLFASYGHGKAITFEAQFSSFSELPELL